MLAIVIPNPLDWILDPRVVVHLMRPGIVVRRSKAQGLGQALLAFVAAMLAALWSQAFPDPGYLPMSRDLALTSGAVLGLAIGTIIVVRSLRTFARAMPDGFAVASGGRKSTFRWSDLATVRLEPDSGSLQVVRRDGEVVWLKARWLARNGREGVAPLLEECSRFIELERVT